MHVSLTSQPHCTSTRERVRGLWNETIYHMYTLKYQGRIQPLALSDLQFQPPTERQAII